MIQFLAFLFGSLGLSYIVTQSDLLAPFRMYISLKEENTKKIIWWYISKLINCIKCFGFWSGIFCYIFIYGFSYFMIIFGFVSVGFIHLVYEFKKK